MLNKPSKKLILSILFICIVAVLSILLVTYQYLMWQFICQLTTQVLSYVLCAKLASYIIDRREE
jgi:hypothetical protein